MKLLGTLPCVAIWQNVSEYRISIVEGLKAESWLEYVLLDCKDWMQIEFGATLTQLCMVFEMVKWLLVN